MSTLGRGFVYSISLHCAAIAALILAQAPMSLCHSVNVDLAPLMLDIAKGSPSSGGGLLRLRGAPGQAVKTPSVIKGKTRRNRWPSPHRDKHPPARTVATIQITCDAVPSVKETAGKTVAGPAKPVTEDSPSGGSATDDSGPKGVVAKAGTGGSGDGLDNGGIYNVASLDHPPVAVCRQQPDYPSRARREAIEGWVKIEFLVDERGRVEHVRIIGAKPAGVFEQCVQEGASEWRFTPGTIKGKPVDTLVATTIRFRLKDDP